MPVGISNIAHTLRDQLAFTQFPVALSHCQQLIAAALGYKTFASCQTAQKLVNESTGLLNVRHVLIDQALLSERAHGLEIKHRRGTYCHWLLSRLRKNYPAPKSIVRSMRWKEI